MEIIVRSNLNNYVRIGISLYILFNEGDIIEFYKIKEVKRKLLV